jgi:hypothetical protein
VLRLEPALRAVYPDEARDFYVVQDDRRKYPCPTHSRGASYIYLREAFMCSRDNAVTGVGKWRAEFGHEVQVMLNMYGAERLGSIG